MARENKTRYAVLGLLTWQPMSGYDVKKQIERGLGNFWSESYGQIYPVLARLVKDGLAESKLEPQKIRPDRIVYSITDKGRDELRQWLSKPTDPQKERAEVLLKLFFGLQMPVEDSVEHVKRARQEHADALNKCAGIENWLGTEREGHPNLPFWLLTVSCGKRVSQAYIDWCDEALATLAKMAEDQA